MYLNLRAEMVRKGINVKTLSEIIGIPPATLYARLNGSVPFTLDEAAAIKNALSTEMTIEQLFEKRVIG